MLNWIENKYVSLVSSRLDRFRRVKENFNFRCPFCRDSEKSKTKARGWILTSGTNTRYYCHNCGKSLKFDKFLKQIDHELYYDYVKDLLIEKNDSHYSIPVIDENKFITKTKFEIKLKKVSQLDYTHPCKRYVDSRLIPSKFHYKIFFAPKFKKWVNTLIPDKFENMEFDEPRLVLPFYDKDNNFFGFQGRSFKKNSLAKYITILLDESKPKIFGLERLNANNTVYIVEGPIDSLFLDNAVASCGGMLEHDMFDKSNSIIVYDNEPRSIETVNKIKKAISNGWRVCLWPENISCKDINDMILNKYTADQIKEIIEDNSFSGLTAELKFTQWSKI